MASADNTIEAYQGATFAHAFQWLEDGVPVPLLTRGIVCRFTVSPVQGASLLDVDSMHHSTSVVLSDEGVITVAVSPDKTMEQFTVGRHTYELSYVDVGRLVDGFPLVAVLQRGLFVVYPLNTDWLSAPSTDSEQSMPT